MTPEEFAEKYTNGNLLQAKVILQMGYPWKEEEYGCIYTEFIENVDILKFLRGLDIPFCEYTFTKAVSNTKVPFYILKWLHKQGCPWDEKTFDNILYSELNNRLEILKWVIGQGCPMKKECLSGIIYDWDKSSRDQFMLWVKDGCQ